MLRQALDIVQAAGLHHSRAYSKLALLLDAEGKGDEALPLFRLAGRFAFTSQSATSNHRGQGIAGAWLLRARLARRCRLLAAGCHASHV